MKSQCSLPTSKRGYALVEMLVAAGLVLMLMSGIVSFLSTAGKMEQYITLQTDTNRGAVHAMNRVMQDVRPAKEVEVLSDHQFRIYYPVLNDDGYYDRTRLDRDQYVEYAQTDTRGRVNPSGGCIWRRTESQRGEAVATDVRLMRVSLNSPTSVRLNVHLQKSFGNSTGSTRLYERVLYLRNH